MKEFILLVRVPTTYTREQANEAKLKWNALIDNWKSENIFVARFVFSGGGYVLSGTNREVKKEYAASDSLMVVASLVLQAENIETMVELSKACPVLDCGGTIEIREVPAPVAMPD